MGRSILLIKGNEERHVINAWQSVVGTLRQFEMDLSMARPTLRARFDLLTEEGYKALLRNPIFSLVEEKKIDESDIRRDSSANDTLLEKNPDGTYALVQVEVTGMFSFGSQQIFLSTFNATGNAGVRCDGIHINWMGLDDKAIPRTIEVEAKDGKFQILNPTAGESHNPFAGFDAPYKLKPRHEAPKDDSSLPDFYSFPDYYRLLDERRESEEKAQELKRRNELAEKSGRVTDGKPDFIGKWTQKVEPPIPPGGCFEVFIKSRNGTKVSGVIEDTLGRAHFEGEMKGDKIKFQKEYTRLFDPNGYGGRLVYQGKKIGDKFSGTFSDSYGGDIRGTFEMNPFAIQ